LAGASTGWGISKGILISYVTDFYE